MSNQYETADKILKYLFAKTSAKQREEIENEIKENIIPSLASLVEQEYVFKSPAPKQYYTITEKGKELINRYGSYSAYRLEERKEKEAQVELIQDQKKDIPKNSRYRIITIVVSVLSLLEAIVIWWLSQRCK